MRTTSNLLPSLIPQSLGLGIAVVFMSACGTMQETVVVRDDAYDIPDRTLVASVEPVAEPEAQSGSDDYYNAEEASNYQQGSYYDRTYNDPAWYNRDRFGFGYNSSPWGNSWNMSYGMGWGNNTGFNSPTGYYDPYWGNSWQSGYGYYDPWNGGMYDPWGWNSGWGNGCGCGNGWGMNSYNGWGNNWGCGNGWGNGWGNGSGFNPYGFGGWGGGSDFSQTVIVRPRPSMSGGGAQGGAKVNVVPRSARLNNGISLMRPSVERMKPGTDQLDISWPASRERGRVESPGTLSKERQKPERKQRTERPARTRERSRDTSPSIERNGGGGNSGGGSRGGGGGSTPSPRPRR